MSNSELVKKLYRIINRTPHIPVNKFIYSYKIINDCRCMPFVDRNKSFIRHVGRAIKSRTGYLCILIKQWLQWLNRFESVIFFFNIQTRVPVFGSDCREPINIDIIIRPYVHLQSGRTPVTLSACIIRVARRRASPAAFAYINYRLLLRPRQPSPTRDAIRA